VEVTRIPLIDLENGGLFARLTYADALVVAERERARIIAPATLLELGLVGLQLMPYLGTPTAETGIVHSRKHDADVWRQLHRDGWDNETPVSGAGKHWVSGAPEGRSRLMGWDRDGSGPGTAMWQPLAVAHNRDHHDDGTTTMLERGANSDADTTRRETPPTPTSEGESSLRVRRWQQWLNAHDTSSPILVADGIHGPKTTAKAASYWRSVGLEDVSEARIIESEPGVGELRRLGDIIDDVIPARNFTWAGRPLSSIRWIVLHSTENPIRPGVARNVARWFGGPSAPRASAHYIVGPDAVIAGVPLEHVAWAAPGANRLGIQVEQVGQALQTDWLAEGSGDRAGLAVLRRSAELVAALCRETGIPVARVDTDGLKRGGRGITTHAAVTRAFRRSDHVDPGGAVDGRWPWAEYLDLVRR
jgi:hypothetical protein